MNHPKSWYREFAMKALVNIWVSKMADERYFANIKKWLMEESKGVRSARFTEPEIIEIEKAVDWVLKNDPKLARQVKLYFCHR